ncbi:MAG: Unknown protein [uncultured Sulfurovum sp.]|uniref:DUF5644 domain-containing protein n=1 Tax=uncultured Sulfurovum sp. TaxID=269237 RepID=A0A6S6SPS3_9BACT|nr:MAG: Unknown protein [uncultured Sulfurovum sp.]
MPFENMINLQVRAFFFNSATDYLPYYKNFDISVNKNATLLNVLDKVKAKNPDFSFPNKNIILKINHLVTTADTLVSDVVATLGREIQIDPATSYRANNGLILNDDDFMESFELLAPYASEADKAYYQSLYALHYASESNNYNRQYIGDAILILASKMINDGNENKQAILEAISDEYNGIRCCEYENNVLNGKDYKQEIRELKEMLTLKDTVSCFDKLSFGKRNHEIDSKELTNANVALYVGSNENTEKAHTLILENVKAYIHFSKAHKLAGQTLMSTHHEIAHKKAGSMLLDALDSGANILVCVKDDDAHILQKALFSCERIMGRDIKLKITSLSKIEDLSSQTV